MWPTIRITWLTYTYILKCYWTVVYTYYTDLYTESENQKSKVRLKIFLVRSHSACLSYVTWIMPWNSTQSSRNFFYLVCNVCSTRIRQARSRLHGRHTYMYSSSSSVIGCLKKKKKKKRTWTLANQLPDLQSSSGRLERVQLLSTHYRYLATGNSSIASSRTLDNFCNVITSSSSTLLLDLMTYVTWMQCPKWMQCLQRIFSEYSDLGECCVFSEYNDVT